MNRNVGLMVRVGISSAFLLTMLTLGSFSASAHEKAPQATSAVSVLAHAPNGTAHLQWNPVNKALTVRLVMSGLQSNSRHPAHIHAGSCPIDGTILYTLNDIVADAAGNGISATTFANVANSIPATGWHVNVHVGPTLAAGPLVIACGNVANPGKVNRVTATLGALATTNQNAYGKSILTLSETTLTVKTTVSNLVPGSSHVAHIHVGSCERQVPGNILYPLTKLTANANGVATSVTTIENVKDIATSGWYINIHFGTDLSTQAGYDVIACGNVITS